MVEILKSFEQVAGRFSLAVLALPGLAMVLLGLVAWLAGTCLRRLVPGLIGAMAGGMAGFFFGGRNPGTAGLASTGGAAFGAGLPRLFVAVALAVLGVAVAFAVLARSHLAQEQGPLFSGLKLDQTDGRFAIQESLEIVQAYVLDAADWVKAIARKLASTDLMILVAVGGGLLAAGLLFERLAGALTYSTVGSGLVYAGLTLLLILKGSAPITRMEQQGALYGLVLLGMIAFGTLEQLLLCPKSARERDGTRGKSASGPEESKRSWRNR